MMTKGRKRLFALLLAVAMALAVAPGAVAEGKSYTLEAADVLKAVSGLDLAEEEETLVQAGTEDFFDVQWDAQAQVAAVDPLFEGEPDLKQQVLFGSPIRDAVGFCTSGAVEVTVWWVANLNNGSIALYSVMDADASPTFQESGEEGKLNKTSFLLTSPGTYTLGFPDDGVGLCKLEVAPVTETVEEPPVPQEDPVPDTPEEPQTPEENQVPEEPQTPEENQIPEEPQTPEENQVPEEPQTPEENQVPEEPQTPAENQTPEEPQTPPAVEESAGIDMTTPVILSVWQNGAYAVVEVELPSSVDEVTVAMADTTGTNVVTKTVSEVGSVYFPITASGTYVFTAYIDNPVEIFDRAIVTDMRLMLEAPVLTLEPSDSGIVLRWSAVPEADGYVVYQKELGDEFAQYESVNQDGWLSSSVLSYNVTGLGAGKTYSFMVRVHRGESEAVDSAAVTYETAPAPIEPSRKAWDTVAAPRIDSAIVLEDGTLQVSISAAIGFNGGDELVLTLLDENQREMKSLSTVMEADAHSLTITSLSYGKYYLRAELIRSGEAQKLTAPTVSVEFSPKAPGAPEITGLKRTCTGGVKLAWSEVANADGYNIYINGNQVAVNADPITATRYELKNLTLGTKYSFAVTAVCAGVESPRSNAVEVTAAESHNWDTAWVWDSSSHWHTCKDCGAVSDKDTHSLSAWTQEGVYHVRSCSCGYTEREPHVADSRWSFNETRHWHICTTNGCSAILDEGLHTYSNDSDATCNDCGYTRTLGTNPIQYKILSGSGSQHTLKDGKDMQITCNGALEKLTSIKMDGVVVEAKNYSLTSGSTIVTLKSSYLDTLKTGDHTLTLTYTDGTATAKLVVAEHTHSYTSWLDNGDGETHSRSCSCGDKQTQYHRWDNGKVTVRPTATKTGTRTYTCKDCGAKLYKELAAGSSAFTGDTFRMGLWITVMVVSAVAIIGIVIYVKVKSSKKSKSGGKYGKYSKR